MLYASRDVSFLILYMRNSFENVSVSPSLFPKFVGQACSSLHIFYSVFHSSRSFLNFLNLKQAQMKLGLDQQTP